MLVAIVTAPGRPASAIVSPSRWACSGFAFSTTCLTPFFLRSFGELLRDLDRDRAHQHRLPGLVARLDLVQHGVPLAVLGLVDLVVVVGPHHRPVGRDVDHRQLVDLDELVRLGERGAGHARELVVQAEVVLERDRRERLVLLAHVHALLGLDRLVQSLRPAAAVEDAAGELVDDLHLAVDHRVLLVALVERLRLQRLDQVVDDVAVLGEVHVLDAEELLDLRRRHARWARRSCASRRTRSRSRARRRRCRASPSCLHLGHALERGSEPRELAVEVARLLGRAGDDQRRARLVDQDVVDLVDDAEGMAALHDLLERAGHVVAQVVEAELRVGAVGDVGGVGLAPLLGAHLFWITPTVTPSMS